MENLFSTAMQIAYPGAIERGDGKPFARPAAIAGFLRESEKIIADTSGFFWTNLDGDRFYFETAEEAAQDLATDIGLDEDEAHAILAAGKAVA